MSPIPGAVSVAPPARAMLRLCAFAAALAVAGCGAGGLPSPAGTVGPPGSTAAAPSAATAPSTATPLSIPTPAPRGTTPRPTEQPGPPSAALVVGGGVPVPGTLGSYVWDGAGSDAPWIVPPESQGVRAAGPYALTIVPMRPVERWRAAWARVDAGSAGDPEANSTGDRLLMTVPGPGGIGTWSLKVDIRFADGNTAAWYWRVEVLP